MKKYAIINKKSKHFLKKMWETELNPYTPIAKDAFIFSSKEEALSLIEETEEIYKL